MPTLPAASTTLAGLSAWSDPVFQALLPYAYFAAGIIIGVGLIVFVIYLGKLIASHLHRN